MKKISIVMLLTITVFFSVSVFSEPNYGEDYDRDRSYYGEDYDRDHTFRDENYEPGFALVDVVILRPLGLAFTIAGTGLFIGLSPLTALAHISPPHDAFKKVADVLIIAPGAYTFSRPVGHKSLIHFPEP